jgi:transposase
MIKHSEEFKQEAVGIALSSGLPRARVAPDLGVGKSTLGKWLADYRPANWCRRRKSISLWRMNGCALRTVSRRRRGAS